MTKEEFANLITDAIELEDERRHSITSQEQRLTLACFSSQEEIEKRDATTKYIEMQYRENQSMDIRRRLAGLVNIPAYARIEAMSAEELETYRQEEIEHTEEQIREQQTKEEQTRANIEKHTEQITQLTGDYNLSFEVRRQEIAHLESIIRGNENSLRNDSFGIAIRNLEQKIDTIKAKTTEDIRRDELSKIEGYQKLEETMQYMEKMETEQQYALALAVGADATKTREVALLMAEHVQYEVKKRLPTAYTRLLFDTLPLKLVERLKRIYGAYDIQKSEVYKPDKIEEEIASYEEHLAEDKRVIEEEFTLEKLNELIKAERRHPYADGNVNFDFLALHINKISDPTIIEKLRSDIAAREKSNKKFLQTKKVKEKTAEIDGKIKEAQATVYTKIRTWYREQYYSLSANTYKNERDKSAISFSSEDSVKGAIFALTRGINIVERGFGELRKSLADARQQIDFRREEYEVRQMECRDKIREIAGPGFEKFELLGFVDGDYKCNISKISNYYANAVVQDKLNHVRVEAQNQADMYEKPQEKLIETLQEDSYDTHESVQVIPEEQSTLIEELKADKEKLLETQQSRAYYSTESESVELIMPSDVNIFSDEYLSSDLPTHDLPTQDVPTINIDNQEYGDGDQGYGRK